ncbi:hypothetical protein [Clostridium lacusfryxellense]|uniref:hypothetical protein n=1 Tax=Clostridium lacusfryxellense TaxID=205328 RepID=UPI001C0C06D0|nr:hypothetical protein [Clostridium lacusfryxellense]MBU3112715.1 hypothetical protein [Clostridium lacusfryxellense]
MHRLGLKLIKSVLLSIGSNQTLGAKEGDIRIIDGFAEARRFGSVNRIIEYEEEFSYNYEDYKYGWYDGGN